MTLQWIYDLGLYIYKTCDNFLTAVKMTPNDLCNMFKDSDIFVINPFGFASKLFGFFGLADTPLINIILMESFIVVCLITIIKWIFSFRF